MPPASPCGARFFHSTPGNWKCAWSEVFQASQEGARYFVQRPADVGCLKAKQGFLLHRQVRRQIDVRYRWAFVPEPARDDGNVDTGLQQVHGGRVSDDVRRHRALGKFGKCRRSRARCKFQPPRDAGSGAFRIASMPAFERTLTRGLSWRFIGNARTCSIMAKSSKSWCAAYLRKALIDASRAFRLGTLFPLIFSRWPRNRRISAAYMSPWSGLPGLS